MTTKWNYYESVKQLAREKRVFYGINSKKIDLNVIRRIYKQEGIKIKFAKKSILRKLKAAYFNDGNGKDVLLNSQLPREAQIFALIHELKHHYLDINDKDVLCLKAYDEESLLEKSAEVFAAEFIWPEAEFQQHANSYGLTNNNCSPETIVRFKKWTGIPVSYKFILKRLEWFGLVQKGQYDKIKFKNVEYGLFGKPYYFHKT